jgi:hypothetical protein
MTALAADQRNATTFLRMTYLESETEIETETETTVVAAAKNGIVGSQDSATENSSVTDAPSASSSTLLSSDTNIASSITDEVTDKSSKPSSSKSSKKKKKSMLSSVFSFRGILPLSSDKATVTTDDAENAIRGKEDPSNAAAEIIVKVGF